MEDCDLHYKNANERDYAIKLRIRECRNEYVASGALFGSDWLLSLSLLLFRSPAISIFINRFDIVENFLWNDVLCIFQWYSDNKNIYLCISTIIMRNLYPEFTSIRTLCYNSSHFAAISVISVWINYWLLLLLLFLYRIIHGIKRFNWTIATIVQTMSAKRVSVMFDRKLFNENTIHSKNQRPKEES